MGGLFAEEAGGLLASLCATVENGDGWVLEDRGVGAMGAINQILDVCL